MHDFEQQLRDLAREPVRPARPLERLQDRVRRRRRQRLLTTSLVAVLGVIGIVGGAAALLTTPGPRAPEIVGSPDGEPTASPERSTSERPQSERSPSPGDASPSSAGMFVPSTTQTDGQTRVAVTLPDGTTGTLRYPSELAVVDDGVTATARIRLSDDLAPTTTGRLLVARPGPVDDVVAAVAAPQQAQRTGTLAGAGGRDVARWDLGGGVEVLATQLDGWTALVAVGGANPRGEPLDEQQQAVVAADLAGGETADGETADGFLALDVGQRLTIDRSTLVIGTPQPARTALEDGYYIPEGGALTVAAANCTSDAETSSQVTVSGGTASASWCVDGLRLSTHAPEGERDAVARHLEAVAATDVSLSDWIVDRSWVTEQQMRAETGGTPDRLWVAGAFYRPGTMYSGALDPDDLVLRYKPVDAAPDQDVEEVVRRAFAALAGPPPPGLDHALDDLSLEVLDLRVDGDVVTIDLPGDLVAPTSRGSTAGMLSSTQIVAEVAHYFPDASTLCILIDGEGGLGEQEGPFLFHERDACPIDLP